MKVSVFGVSVASYTKMTDAEGRVLPWVAVKGEEKYRFVYDLNQNSVVYDVGGYMGEWAEPIIDRFDCYLEIFEPVKQFLDILETKFKARPKINIYPYGLAGKTGTAKINVDLEASSLFKHDAEAETIRLERVSKQIRHDKIDLIKINIEGGEFDLLEDLIKTGNINRFVNLQLQFHVFAPKAYERRKKLQAELSKTHELTFNYRFVWENWRIKRA